MHPFDAPRSPEINVFSTQLRRWSSDPSGPTSTFESDLLWRFAKWLVFPASDTTATPSPCALQRLGDPQVASDRRSVRRCPFRHFLLASRLALVQAVGTHRTFRSSHQMWAITPSHKTGSVCHDSGSRNQAFTIDGLAAWSSDSWCWSFNRLCTTMLLFPHLFRVKVRRRVTHLA